MLKHSLLLLYIHAVLDYRSTVLVIRHVVCVVPWLWSHGYSDSEIDPSLADIKAVYKGSAKTQEILQRYGVSYIYLSPLERKEFDIKALPANWPFPAVFHHGDITIYQVR